MPFVLQRSSGAITRVNAALEEAECMSVIGGREGPSLFQAFYVYCRALARGRTTEMISMVLMFSGYGANRRHVPPLRCGVVWCGGSFGRL